MTMDDIEFTTEGITEPDNLIGTTTGFDSSIADHDYYIIPGTTDVDKMRDDAYRRQQGDYYNRESESTVIHFHRFNEPCDKDPDKHQVFLRLEKEDG